MEENPDEISISPKKLEANRRNAQRSTGPKTEEGKSQSRRNALKHGILASALLITEGQGGEDPTELDELLGALSGDLAPVGRLEEMLVEKIAVCWWRQKRALRCEAGMIRVSMDMERGGLPPGMPRLDNESAGDFKRRLVRYKQHLSLPVLEHEGLARILRYETTIHRQLVYAINQLERLQRAHKGDQVPAPVSVQFSSDQ